MSVLAVTIGNTNIHFGMYNQNMINKKTLPVAASSNCKEIIDVVESFLKNVNISRIQIASVNPRYTDAVVTCLKQFKDIPLRQVKYDDSYWSVDYSSYQKRTLGIDRMLVCEAAIQRKKLPAIIFDFGTATTMNVVDENGVFSGGAIFPGINMGLEALTNKTAQLPQIELDDKVPNLLGKSTTEAMKSAAVHGNIAMAEGMVKKVENALGKQVHVYITGGAAQFLAQSFQIKIQWEANFLLEGLLNLN